MLNKFAKKFITALILAIVVLSLSGCRESMVIQEIIYDQASEDIDFQNKTMVAENDDQSDDKDENLTKKKDDEEAEKKKDDKKVASSKGDKKNDGKASKVVSDPNGRDNEKANKSDSGTGNGNENNGGASGDDSAGASDDPNSREITDSSGNTVTLPDEVNSVVAPGSAAGIVQMLGGKDILSGTSSSFLSNQMAQNAFGGEGLSKAETLWDGSGSEPMSAENFNKLLSMKPDVCIGVSGEMNFSDSQIAKLKEKKISYVVLPRQNTAYNIEDAVTITGKMIGDRSGDGGVDAASLASEYTDYCHDLVKEVSSRTGVFTWNNIDFNNDILINGEKTISGSSSNGKYTLYISDWDSSATYRRSSSGAVTFEDSSGVAVAPQGYSNSPMSYYMSVAGVCNNGARMIKNNKDQYAAVPFALNTANNSIVGSSLSIYPTVTENFARAWNGGSIDVGLGENKFPALVVDSKATKSKIENSKSWESYGRQTVGNKTEWGPIGANGDIITSYVRDNYDIYVNPSGMFSWTDGSVESVLECVWAAWKINGAYSQSEVEQEIKNFYSKFYRYNLSDSQVSQILAGR